MTRYRPDDRVDFVIIGAGAAGGVMAKELSTAGFRIVVLEQGPYLHEHDFKHDEVGTAFRNQLTNDPKRQPSTFRKTGSAKAAPAPSRAVIYGRMVGGGTAHFTANYWRFHEIDFVERSKWGAISDTGFDDWPIRYAELEPYYTKAEEELGVSGLAGASPFDPPRSKPYPLPPLPVKSSGVIFERAARKLGLHPFPSPMAILSKPYRGRNACLHCGFCEGYGCEVGAKSSTLASVIPVAERTSRCEIRAKCYVRQIEVDKAGRVTGATYFNTSKREVFQRAKAVVVCCNGSETPRLLLMSRSSRFPDGLANSSGLVGKYLMFDSGAFCGATFEHALNDFKSVQVSRLLHDFYDADPKRGFFGGGGIDARFDLNPIAFAQGGLPQDAPQWGADYKRMLRESFTHTMYLLAHSTTLPLESNSISLDPDVKDFWGLPALRVTFKNHSDDLKTMQFLLDRQMEILDAAGARRTWAYPVEETTQGVHLLGTCRMGTDPKRSVIDPYHRSHDVPNLFLVDGSSFVTSGRNQPTCTIQALAYRAADLLARATRRGEI
jgi:choline dehydrogenase-like flavoprotein